MLPRSLTECIHLPHWLFLNQGFTRSNTAMFTVTCKVAFDGGGGGARSYAAALQVKQNVTPLKQTSRSGLLER